MSKAIDSVPEYGPLPSSKSSKKVSEVWALAFYEVYKGYIRVSQVRAHAKGPCAYPETMHLKKGID